MVIIIKKMIKYIEIDAGLEFFLMLEATMPTAVSLVIIGQYRGADNNFLSGMIFYSHVAAILTIPFWLWCFKVFG